MFLQNFKVAHRILNNVAQNSLSVRRFSKRVPRGGKFVEWPENQINLTPKQYKKKLEQCPKPFQQLHRKKFFFKPKTKKCEATTASDDYVKARRSLELRIKDTIKFVEDESQTIANDVNSQLEKSRVARTAQSEGLYEKTTEKLDKLIKLDVSYGFWMRRETLLLNDEIRRSFDALERAITLNVKRVESMLRNLRNGVSICVKRAEKNLAACRKHNSPCEFAVCVKEQSEEATRMLDRANEEARVKLEEIAKFRESVIKAHEMISREAIEINRKKAAELSDYLERCIAQLKKSSK